MKFDADAFRSVLLDVLSQDLPVTEAMTTVIGQLSRIDSRTDWSPLLSLRYDDEVTELARVLTRILSESPPPATLNGFIFGADELFEAGSSRIAIQLVSAERIDADDPDFGQSRYDLRYEPPIAITSDILQELHLFANGLEPEWDSLNLENSLAAADLSQFELGGLADHLLLWSYTALAVARAAELTKPAVWLVGASSRKIYVGHGDDYLRLGLIVPKGFRRSPLFD